MSRSTCLPRAAAVRPRAGTFALSRSLLALAACWPATALHAQGVPPTNDPATAGGGERIVVTGARTPMRIDQSLAEVTVIDRAQLDRAGGHTLAQWLAQQPGVQFTANGGPGTASSLMLRGLEARHTLLLVDGVRYGSATLGTPAWENIPLEAIERIEIVRGPLSALYGADAAGGVIQVFTRGGAQGLRVDGGAGVGSHGARTLDAGLRLGQGAFDGALHVAHQQTRGFSATNPRVPYDSFNPDDDGFRQNSVTARAGWRVSTDWRLEASVLHSEGLNHYDDGAGADARAELRTQVLALQARGRFTPGWRTVLRAARSSDEYDTLASASPWASLGTIGTVQRQLSWEHSIDTPAGTALLLAEHLRQNVSRPDQPFDVSERSINGVAAGLTGEAGAHHWQANLRHDRNSQFGGQTTGALAWGLDLAPAWRLGASWGSSFVAPSFNQLYYPGWSNPLLQPERGRHAELSLRWSVPGQQARLAWFDNRIRGYITSGPTPDNIPRTRIDGLSASYEATLGAWTLAGSLDHVDPRNKAEGSAHDKLLPRRARDSARLSADTTLGAWKLGAGFNAYGARWDDRANTVRVAGYGTLDLRADWRFAPGWTLALRLDNAADKVYETVYGYNQPRREWRATLRYAGW